jgi:cobalt-precorrin-5B (C1)-methyltransferase
LHLANGQGVGLVTRPGLPVEVGQPAINPVPRRMITQAVRAELGSRPGSRGLTVTISVPHGETLARETLNPRLGLLAVFPFWAPPGLSNLIPNRPTGPVSTWS